MSSWPYLTTPARSAWPGRGRVTTGRSTPAISAAGSAFDGHRPLPVLPVLVGNQQRDRTAGRHAVPDAAQDLRAIGLDGHPPAAAVAGLAPAQLRGDRVEVDREARRHAFENGDERLAVRLAGGEKSQHRAFILSNSVETTSAGRRRSSIAGAAGRWPAGEAGDRAGKIADDRNDRCHTWKRMTAPCSARTRSRRRSEGRDATGVFIGSTS